MSKVQNLKQFANQQKCTLLCVGVVSVNVVDTVIYLSKRYNIPLTLLVTRRQVEIAEFGGGYVNGWTPEQFAEYVRQRSAYGQILLARDHGGPWQNPIEQRNRYRLTEAVESAKRSYAADIEAGFDVIHIDPNKGVTEDDLADGDTFTELSCELIRFCYEKADEFNRDICIEIGTDEGLIGSMNASQIGTIVLRICDFCKQNDIPLPGFLVVQTGTHVKEMKNVGVLDREVRELGGANAFARLNGLVDLSRQLGIITKSHNADYIADQTIASYRGHIDAANVAPEFGVAETRMLLTVMENLGQNKLAGEFLQVAFDSGWHQKWMLPNTTATDYDRAIIAGHYVFSTPEFSEIKHQLSSLCESKGIDLDKLLQEAIEKAISRYLKGFGMI